MKSPYINELELNQPLTACFLVHSKEVREKKTGEPYLSLMLGDKTGKIDAKMWDNVAEVLSAFDRDDFVKVKASMQLHLNRPQLTIFKLRAMEDHEIDFADFFPASLRNPDEMWSELRRIVAGVQSRPIRALLDALLDDPEIARRYRLAPAAKTIHHAFLGGLLEHVLSLCNLCKLTAPHYPMIDLDLMIAGAVLHDIGKIYELSYDRGFSYTTQGQLLGHMMIALRMVSDKLRGLPDFPEPLRTLLEHIIISHHGHLEFGSPKLPQFPEALLFHYLDDMDSKMECMRNLLDSDRQLDGCFTPYNTSLERSVLKKSRFLDPAPPAAPVAQKPPVPAATPPAPPPQPTSVFAGKLQPALTGD
ncbi:MAG: HD domain-containing protein [Acidobacteriota bacterium]|nr:HD domain-containing protein [Acidobacteriota bacterium]